MRRVPARLFGPGLAAGGEAVELELSDGALAVPGRPELAVALSQVSLTLAGFGLDEWQLAWLAGDARYAAHLADKASLQRLAARPPAGLLAQVAAVGRAGRQRQRRAMTVWGVLGLAVLLPFLLLGLFVWQSARIAGWLADRIPIEQERQLGELVFAREKPALKLIGRGPAAQAVSEIGARLTQGSAYRYRFYLAQSPEVNAYAVPGGTVVVYTGLLARADSAEELAGVLAHEVQHVERRHSLKALVHGLGLSALASLALGDASGGVAAGMAQQLAGLSFSREQESDADLHGLDALRRAGIAPQGMLRFYRKLASSQGGATPAMLSTHPTSDARFAALEAELGKKGGWPARPLPYDWGTIKASLKP